MCIYIFGKGVYTIKLTQSFENKVKICVNLMHELYFLVSLFGEKKNNYVHKSYIAQLISS